MRILPFGDAALLAECADLAEVRARLAALRSSMPPGVVDVVPALRTLLVRVDPTILGLHDAERWLARSAPAEPEARAGELVRIAVRYAGPDLAETAGLLGLTAESLVRRHTEAEWECAFIGFAPGFAYLVADGFPFDVPRHATSRPQVPAGSVALAGRFGGVYPRSSPGGWRLIGSTEATLWDESREHPALLPPGTRVRFEAV